MNTRLLGACVLLLAVFVISAVTLAASPAPVMVDDTLPVPQLDRDYRGWVQVNTSGFGDANNAINAMVVFNNKIYAGTANDNGAGVWTSSDGLTWTPVTITGWTTNTTEVAYLRVFGSYLYLGTTNMVDGAEIWRTNNGTTWTRVVPGGFGDAESISVGALGVLGSNIYAFVGHYVAGTNTPSLLLWRSNNGTTWLPVSLGDMSGVWPSLAVDIYNGYLYLGLCRVDKAELWRSNNGTTWTPVFTGSLTVSNTHVLSMADYGGYLYIGFRNMTGGAQVWRSADGVTDWKRRMSTGLGNPQNFGAYGLFVFNNKLYTVLGNFNTGSEIWRTSDANSWEGMMQGGWGSSAVRYNDYFDKNAVIFNNRLYIGSYDGPSGGEIWKKTVTADFSADQTIGKPPLTVHFANRSAGDYTTSFWRFGDGGSSDLATPAHTYTAIGAYTVTLTVSDGYETNTITRTQYIKTRYLLYAPIILNEQ